MEDLNLHPLYKKHNIDSAMNSLWEFYKGRFIPLFVISLVMSLITQYASTLIDVKELQNITDPLLLLEKMKDYVVPFAIISLVSLLFSTILQYYVIYNPLNKSVTIFTALYKSLRYFIPYLIIMVLLAFAGGIAIVLGLFLLIVGAFFAMIYVMTLYLFVLPVLMIEDNSIGLTISRSFSLMHRKLWPNIGWTAVFLIIMIVVSVLLSALILIPFTGGFLKSIFGADKSGDIANITTKPLYIFLSAIAGALTMPAMPIFACILYFNGRANENNVIPQAEIVQENVPVRVEDLYAKPYSDDHPDNPENKNKE